MSQLIREEEVQLKSFQSLAHSSEKSPQFFVIQARFSNPYRTDCVNFKEK